jgi:RHS repeat-associated protein
MMLNNHIDSPRKLSEGRSNRITVASYTYNHLNQRISKTTPDSIAHYHHDAQGRLWSETDGLGNTIRDYIWMGDMPIAMVDYPEGIERVTYLHADHLNTPRYGTNQTGDVVWQWQSDAFGNGLPTEDVDSDGVSVQINLRFPGQYYDAESDLHYNWNRYYDPSIGRYITSDPIGLDGGLNTYSYVLQNPLRFYDPNGLETANLFGQNTRHRTFSQGIIGPKGEMWLIAHGNSQGIYDSRHVNGERDKGIYLGIDEVDQFLDQHGWKQGMPITLLSCETGEGDNPIAAQLAKRKGVNVSAPNSLVTYQPINRWWPTWFSLPIINYGAEMRTFTPDGKIFVSPVQSSSDLR